MRRAGFTLVELLVALALLGLVATMALGGVRLGARTWETVSDRAEVTGRVQTVRALLARELSQAIPLRIATTGTSEQLAYEGGVESVTFVAPLASHFGLGGAQRLHLGIVGSEGGPDAARQLVLIRRPFRFDDDFGAEREEDEIHVLLDGIVDAAFSYRAAGEDSGWSGEWRDEERLPGVIRLDVTFRDASAGSWPSLLAATRITADADCLIPVGTTACGVR